MKPALECYGGPLDGTQLEAPQFGATKMHVPFVKPRTPGKPRKLCEFGHHIYEVVDGKYVYRGKKE